MIASRSRLRLLVSAALAFSPLFACSFEEEPAAPDARDAGGLDASKPDSDASNGTDAEGTDAEGTDAEGTDAEGTTDAHAHDAQSGLSDAAADSGLDSGARPDSGVLPDSGLRPDAGGMPDSGTRPDSGVLPDSGLRPDSGVLPDSGLRPDSGVLPDSGIPCVYEVRRVSETQTGVQGNNVSSQYALDISANGTWVAFASLSSNLVSGDDNGRWDVFVKDMSTGAIEVVSTANDGTWGDDHSGGVTNTPFDLGLQQVSISADGRFVAFISRATNLVRGDTNGIPDVFVHDRALHQVTRVSVSSTGVQAVGDTMNRGAESVVMSADGRFVAFDSWSPNLAAGDTNDEEDVFVHDLLTGATERISLSSSGSEASSAIQLSAISGDGRWVAMSGTTNTFVAGVAGGVFLKDRLMGTVEVISRASGEDGAPAASARGADISADTRYVMFSSSAGNLVPDDTNNAEDVFIRDRVDHTTIRVSVDSMGAEGTSTNMSGPFSRNGSMSDDALLVAMHSPCLFDRVNDTNGPGSDVYVRDVAREKTFLVSRDPNTMQSGLGGSVRPRLSADGRFVAFESNVSVFVLPDANPSDIFRVRVCAP